MFKMERHIKRQDSDLQFNRNVSSCLWSIFHILDHHPWHNVKKILPYRKHSRSKEGPNTTLNNDPVAKVPELLNDENEPTVYSTENVPVDKRSGEADVNVSITEEMSEEESQKLRNLHFNSKRRLLRTYSIHHLKHSYYLPGNTSETGDDTVTSPKNNFNHSVNGARTSVQNTDKKLAASGKESNCLDTMNTEDCANGVKETLETNRINRDVSSRSFKEDVDMLEIFKANKKIFAELLQGAHGKHYLQGHQNSKATVGLEKSRTFPAAGLRQTRNQKLSSLEHKQIDSFPKGQKIVSGPEPLKLVESESPKNPQGKMPPFESASASKTFSSSLGPNRVLKHGSWNHMVIKRFNFIKRKIRHAFREKKKAINQKSAKELSSLVPSGDKLPHERQEMEEGTGTRMGKDGMGIEDYNETDSSEHDNISGGRPMTRIASLNASLEKYTRLYEYTLNRNREADHSQGLKLTSEDRILKSESDRKFFRRNLSMPDLDLFCSLFIDPTREVVHADNNIHTDPNSACPLLGVDRSDSPYTVSTDIIEKGGLDIPADSSGSSNTVENDQGISPPDEQRDKIADLDSPGSKGHLVSDGDDVEELSSHGQTLDVETHLQDDATCFIELPDSEDVEPIPECSIANELETSDDLHNESSTLPAYEMMINHDIIYDIEAIGDDLFLHSQPSSTNNADFNYMRCILQLSSFIESDHTIDRSLNPSLLDELEDNFYKKLECYWEKVDENSDHQILLDLVSETLRNTFERSFICFLKSFSSKCQLRQVSLGPYLLEEVREKVSSNLCLGPELDQSLDDVVNRDLGKCDDWMDLQPETESIALDIEDLILDELLDEVIFS